MQTLDLDQVTKVEARGNQVILTMGSQDDSEPEPALDEVRGQKYSCWPSLGHAGMRAANVLLPSPDLSIWLNYRDTLSRCVAPGTYLLFAGFSPMLGCVGPLLP